MKFILEIIKDKTGDAVRRLEFSSEHARHKVYCGLMAKIDHFSYSIKESEVSV